VSAKRKKKKGKSKHLKKVLPIAVPLIAWLIPSPLSK